MIELVVSDGCGDPAALSHAARIGLAIEIEAVRARLDALQQRTLAELHRGDRSEKQWVREEVACALRLAPVTAEARLQDASTLVDSLPATLQALAAARVSWAQARVMIELAGPLDEATRASVEARVLARAQGKTVSEFRQAARRAVLAVDPRRIEEQRRSALEQRRVVFTDQDDATTEVWASLSTEGAARLRATVNRYARATRGLDGRTADQRRADALCDLAELAMGQPITITAPTTTDQPDHADDRTSGRSTKPAHRCVTGAGGVDVQVTVGLMTLLGLDDRPGQLTGLGAVPASVARALAFDETATWRRLLTDPAGRVVDISTTYRPPPSLCDLITARDRTCRFPGCRRPARRCHLDHLRPWPDGLTSEHNLHALCTRHHHLKHEAGWTVARTTDGTTHWHTPTGHHYTAELELYPDDPPIPITATQVA